MVVCTETLVKACKRREMRNLPWWTNVLNLKADIDFVRCHTTFIITHHDQGSVT